QCPVSREKGLVGCIVRRVSSENEKISPQNTSRIERFPWILPGPKSSMARGSVMNSLSMQGLAYFTECGLTGLFVSWLQIMWAPCQIMWAGDASELHRLWAEICHVCVPTR